MEEPIQFSAGQTAQSLTCSITEKQHTGLDECPRILLSCGRASNSDLAQRLHERVAGLHVVVESEDPARVILGNQPEVVRDALKIEVL